MPEASYRNVTCAVALKGKAKTLRNDYVWSYLNHYLLKYAEDVIMHNYVGSRDHSPSFVGWCPCAGFARCFKLSLDKGV
jgi:hypothetical protein